MSNHADVLKRLFPVPLGPNHEADCDAEGAFLDAADARITDLAAEIFPDTAFETLTSWERVCGISPVDASNISARRNAILTQLRATGGMTRAYFIALAEMLGYEGVTIFEPRPFEAGVSGAFDRIYADDAIFCWRVDGVDVPAGAYFRAGDSAAGDRLCAFAVLDIQTLFNALKPAHTAVYFEEPEE